MWMCVAAENVSELFDRHRLERPSHEHEQGFAVEPAQHVQSSVVIEMAELGPGGDSS
jgi:hypothetical protein